MTDYYRGQVVRVSARFDVDDADTDPDALTLTVEDPAGVSTTYTYGVDDEIVRVAVGQFYADLVTADGELGRWIWRWLGTGAAAAGVVEGDFVLVSRLDISAPPDESYASLSDVLSLFDQRPARPGSEQRLAFLAGVATRELIEAEGRDYFMHGSEDYPEVWYADGSGSPILCVHGGIVSLSSVEILIGLTWYELPEDSYVLRGAGARSDEPIPPGEPAFHVVITGRTATFGAFPRGVQAVRLTGIRGWPAIPATRREATAERARQLWTADKTYAGSSGAPEDFQTPAPYVPLPDVYWRLATAERHRFWCSM